jgi:hypothetical protein
MKRFLGKSPSGLFATQTLTGRPPATPELNSLDRWPLLAAN